jgi:hypothetical protein
MRGWWYFFPVALAVKTPLGLLILTLIGFAAFFRAKRPLWLPPALLLAILLICMPSTLNIGVRYVLPLYPMMALTAAIGTVYLFRRGR